MTSLPVINYDFLSPSQIIFGRGRRSEVGGLAAELGDRAFIINGSRTLERIGELDQLRQCLHEAGLRTSVLTTISHEPEVADVDSTVTKLLEIGIESTDLVIGFGGGSAIDLAKAVAALATNRHGQSVTDFLEGVGRGLEIENEPLPLLAIPTTAGTGTEATKNAVISSNEQLFKKSLRSNRMIPNVVLIDPELGTTVPRTTTAASGMDAITQLIESYISRRAKPIPQTLCLAGLKLAIPAIKPACENGSNIDAREKMAHASLLSGMALANSGLGMAHGVAAALGVHCRVPHGLACAVMLPTALEVNAGVCQETMHNLAISAGVAGTSREASAQAFVDFIRSLCDDVGIPNRLSQIGVTQQQIPAIVQSSRGNSMRGNPRELSDQELQEILYRIL
jgi:alcohol dehydrogenase class IV